MELKPSTCLMQSGENAALLLDFCARRLDPARASALEVHLEHCPSCRRFCEAQHSLWNSLDSWELSDPGWDFNHRLRQRLEHEQAAPAWLCRLRAWRSGISWKPAIPLVAAFALWLVVFPPASRRSSAPPAPGQDEQIERILEDVDMLRMLPLEAR